MTRSTRAEAKLQENFLAKFLEARTTPNSGAGRKTKGDLQDDYSLFEAKTSMTPKLSYSIKREDLVKNKFEAIYNHKEFSFLAFDFGNHVVDETYVVVSLEDFKKLYDQYKLACEEGN